MNLGLYTRTLGQTEEIKCGCFNSTDLWNFTGCLIVTSLESTRTAINIVNKFGIIFYYNWETTKNTIRLLSVTKNPQVTTVCRSSEDAQELYRLTGVRAKAIVDNFNLTEISQVERL